MAQKLANDQVGRVFRRYDRLHTMPMRFASYDVNLKAISYEIEGVKACTLFFPKGKDHAADRALKLGWIEETEKWRQEVGLAEKPTIAQTFGHLNWHELRKLASSKGLDLSGKRNDIESRLSDYFSSTSEALA